MYNFFELINTKVAVTYAIATKVFTFKFEVIFFCELTLFIFSTNWDNNDSNDLILFFFDL